MHSCHVEYSLPTRCINLPITISFFFKKKLYILNWANKGGGNPHNLFKSAWPVPTYLAWRCSSCELMLNLSLACIIIIVNIEEIRVLRKQGEGIEEMIDLPASSITKIRNHDV